MSTTTTQPPAVATSKTRGPRPSLPRTREAIERTIAIINNLGSVRAAARHLGVTTSTVHVQLSYARKVGLRRPIAPQNRTCDPQPATIAKRAAEIRSGWTEEEELRRRCVPLGDGRIPVINESELVEAMLEQLDLRSRSVAAAD